MKLGLPWSPFLLAVACCFVAGCSEPSDGVKPENSKALTDAATIAQKVDGDFDKLTGPEKDEIMKVAGNDEHQARTLLKMMAHPPNEAMKKAGGAPPGAPGKKGL